MSSGLNTMSEPDTYNLDARIKELTAVEQWLLTNQHVIENVATLYATAFTRGKTVWFAGNGGSAADAQHVAAEYVGRFKLRHRKPLNARALTVDTSVLTAVGNDMGFNNVFARQLEAGAAFGDVVVMHSTSGNSQNLVVLARQARLMGVKSIALLGRQETCKSTALAFAADAVIYAAVPSPMMTQIAHLAFQHCVAEVIDHWALHNWRRQKSTVTQLKKGTYP